jgi:hypothetical protein
VEENFSFAHIKMAHKMKNSLGWISIT